MAINWDEIKGNWMQLKGKIKEQWGDMTDDEITEIGGQKDQFLGKLQAKYGYAREEAEREVENWYMKNRPRKTA